MIKINLQSDLHLEFFKYALYTPKFAGEDVLILAGDIQMGLHNEDWFVELLRFRDVFYLLGNHEFYREDFNSIKNYLHDFEKVVNKLAKKKKFKHKLYCFQDRALDYKGVRFIGSTLWTDFNKNDPLIKLSAINGMSDFRVIYNANTNITPEDIYDEHVQSLRFIETQLSKDDNIKKVVFTHHCPSYQSIAEYYRINDFANLNYMFYSDLDHLVEKSDKWLHGHTHTSFRYTVGKCEVVCNPRGYLGRDLNPDFKEDLIIEI